MAVPARRTLMTAEQLFELPDDGYRSELVDGEIIRMTPSGAEHGVLSSRIGRLLDEHASAQGLGVCCGAETGFILRRDPDVVRAPDAAFVAAARIPKSGIPRTYWPFAPDLAVEVVSPSDGLAAVQAKVAEYFAAGTPPGVARRAGTRGRPGLPVAPRRARAPGRRRVDRRRRSARFQLRGEGTFSVSAPEVRTVGRRGLPQGWSGARRSRRRRWALAQLDYVFASRGFHDRVRVHALNDALGFGTSDHCRIRIDVR